MLTACRARERLRVTRRAARERERLVVEARLLRRREPLAFVARRRLHQVGEDLARLLVRILLRHRAAAGEVRAAAVGADAVAPGGLVDEPARQEDLLAQRVDVAVGRPRARQDSAYWMASAFLAHRRERLHRPALVRPDDPAGRDQLDDLLVAFGRKERAEAGRRAVEVFASAPVRPVLLDQPRLRAGDGRRGAGLDREAVPPAVDAGVEARPVQRAGGLERSEADEHSLARPVGLDDLGRAVHREPVARLRHHGERHAEVAAEDLLDASFAVLARDYPPPSPKYSRRLTATS